MSTRIRHEDRNSDAEDQGMFTNRSTMMANFEEWIKMATDNKINSRNSWNFALIDYFHDLQVLRDSENNINFQKASATLDGCVKIYSSRVDSVTTETGKLLSGLAQSKEKKNKEPQQGGDGEAADADENESGIQIDALTGLPVSNDVEIQGRRRVLNRVLETTLVDFDQIKAKELDHELNIDPIFKKALVDFDEGGAKSFLLNTLSVNASGRVVFDTAIRDVPDEEPRGSAPEAEDASANDSSLVEDEILALGMDFINFDQINGCEVSASIPQLRGVVQDIDKAKTFIEDVNNKFDNFLSEQELQEAVPDSRDTDGPADLDDLPEGDSGPGGVSDDELELAAKADDGAERDSDSGPVISEQEVMCYFDETLRRNWRGREHWKVRSFKQNLGEQSAAVATAAAAAKGSTAAPAQQPPTAAPPPKKKVFEIDFFQLDDKLEETIFGTNKRRANIEMPQRMRTSDSHYLLPDDYHFSSDKITSLFIKPGQKMRLFKRNGPAPRQETAPTLADEKFWAENYACNEQETTRDSDVMQGELENPFGDDEGDTAALAAAAGGVDFNQAFEEPATLAAPALPSAGGQDNKVNYARVSKKVDVRRLKDNLWNAVTSLRAATAAAPLSFADVTRELGAHYSEESRRELSTSFCFICLLHLANEHGLQIENAPLYDDLIIT